MGGVFLIFCCGAHIIACGHNSTADLCDCFTDNRYDIISFMLVKKSFLFKVYLYALLNSLVLIYSLYSITFQAKGLSVAQIGTALIFWSVSVIVLQLPIGMLSDRLSRRNMMIFGNVVVSVAFFIFMMWPTFIGIMTGFALWGLKWAIDAACFQPMVYDQLRNKKKYLSVVGTCESIKLVGYALSALCSFLIFLGYNFLTWCTIGFMGLGALVLLSMPHDKRATRRHTVKRMGMRDIAVAAQYVFTRPMLLGIIIVSAMLNGAGNIDEWLGMIGLELGYPEYAVGALYFSALICGAMGGLAVRGIHKTNRMLLPTLIAGGGLMLAISAVWFNIWATISLCMFWILLTIGQNIIYANFQNSVSTAVRGRTTAVLEIAQNFGSMGIYAIMTCAQTFGGGYKYGLFAIGTILIIMSMTMIKKHRIIK